MIASLNIKDFNISNFIIHKNHNFDVHTIPVAKVQYFLRYYMLFLFEECIKNGSEENFNNLKESINLIKKYSSLHKEFMNAKQYASDKSIFQDILKNHPDWILDEKVWR